MIKRILAWGGIVLIIVVFIYFSLGAFQNFSVQDNQDSSDVEVVSHQDEHTVEKRINIPEVLFMLVIGAVLIYFIRRENHQSNQDARDECKD